MSNPPSRCHTRLVLSPLIVLATVAAYVVVLGGIAWWADRTRRSRPAGRAIMYSLSLGVLCSSWTYFAAVGDARNGSWLYVANALGPILALTAGFPAWRRIAVLAKQENVGSLADFLAARYGKSRALGILATCIATIGALPYVALQLIGLTRALNFAVGTALPLWLETLGLTAIFTICAILLGTRRPSLNQHSRALVTVVALESVVKIAALACVAGLGILLLARTPSPVATTLAAVPPLVPGLDFSFFTIAILCTVSAFTLPRQFHLGFVTLEDADDVRTARWLTPLYFLAWPIATLIIATALRAGFMPPDTAPDLMILALPARYGGIALTTLALLGGLSAGAAMVIVEVTAISAMVSNELIVPWLSYMRPDAGPERDIRAAIVRTRRSTTVAIGVLAWLYFVCLRDVGGPTQLGMTALSASAQLLPALIGGIYWRRGHAHGAVAGIGAGMLIWIVAVAGPAFFLAAPVMSAAGPPPPPTSPGFGFNAAILLSLLVNAVVFALVSIRASPKLIDTIQAGSFIDRPGSTWMAPAAGLGANVGDLRRLLAQFLGEAEAGKALDTLRYSLRSSDLAEDAPVSATLARSAERVLAGVIGAPSARNVLALALAAGGQDAAEISRILDEAAHAVHFSRELLQITLDSLDQGVSVSDGDMRLVAWNARYLQLMGLPPEQVHVGKPLGELLQVVADRQDSSSVRAFIRQRLDAIAERTSFRNEVVLAGDRIVRIAGTPLGNRDYLATFVDITDLKQAEIVLTQSNEALEQRVRERTDDLVATNAELTSAKQLAERATGAQRRFVAAASHDLVQPLHAARLFIGSALAGAKHDGATAALLERADQAVEDAHRLMRALLTLSQLETGGLKPKLEAVDVGALLHALAEEFESQATARGLQLVILPTRRWVRSDRDLLRSVLQNLIVNAIRYTKQGRILVACRFGGDHARFEVRDSGVGIATDQLPAVFAEYSRLAEGKRMAEGTGLGLSIVARISQMLQHEVTVRSKPGIGSVFSVRVPYTAAAPLPALPPGTVGDLSGLRVLCVDDEQDVLLGTSALMERWGTIVTAVSAAEDVEDDNLTWDVVLADYELGDENGLQLLCRLRDRATLRVLVTATTDSQLEQQVILENVRLLRKPVAPLQLQALLAGAKARRHATGERSRESATSCDLV